MLSRRSFHGWVVPRLGRSLSPEPVWRKQEEARPRVVGPAVLGSWLEGAETQDAYHLSPLCGVDGSPVVTLTGLVLTLRAGVVRPLLCSPCALLQDPGPGEDACAGAAWQSPRPFIMAARGHPEGPPGRGLPGDFY